MPPMDPRALETSSKTSTCSALLFKILIRWGTADGSREITYPDGTMITVIPGPDPRWGMQAPLIKSITIKLPSGKSTTFEKNHSIILEDSNNLLSLVSLTETFKINNALYESVFNRTNNTLSFASPGGALSTILNFNSQGRVAQITPAEPSIHPIQLFYYDNGLLQKIQQGDQFWFYTYDPKNQLTNITNASQKGISYKEYDNAGRPHVVEVGPTYGPDYDSNGNTKTLTMPNTAIHQFNYSAINLMAQYIPPLSPPANPYIFTYDLDARISTEILPEGETKIYNYDPILGRLNTITYPDKQIILSYDPNNPDQIAKISCIPSNGISQDVVFDFDGDLLTGMDSQHKVYRWEIILFTTMTI